MEDNISNNNYNNNNEDNYNLGRARNNYNLTNLITNNPEGTAYNDTPTWWCLELLLKTSKAYKYKLTLYPYKRLLASSYEAATTMATSIVEGLLTDGTIIDTILTRVPLNLLAALNLEDYQTMHSFINCKDLRPPSPSEEEPPDQSWDTYKDIREDD